MRVLLDECVDWRLAREIAGHDVKSARQMGWTTIKNGELLTLAAKEFDVFVTVDQNLAAQQTLSLYSIAIVILRARTNRLTDLKVLVPKLLQAIKLAKKGAIELIGEEKPTRLR